MDFETDYWIEDSAGVEGDDAFKPGVSGTIARLILFVLLLWVLVSMVFPRRNLILNTDLPPKPPAEQIELHYWL